MIFYESIRFKFNVGFVSILQRSEVDRLEAIIREKEARLVHGGQVYLYLHLFVLDLR